MQTLIRHVERIRFWLYAAAFVIWLGVMGVIAAGNAALDAVQAAPVRQAVLP